MTHTWSPIETYDKLVTDEPVLPFDAAIYDGGRDTTFSVARDEMGYLFHSPICTDFVRYGYCHHMVEARALAEHPGTAFAHAASSMAIFGVEEGDSFVTIAQNILTLAFQQEARRRVKEEWHRLRARTSQEIEDDALDALARHSGERSPHSREAISEPPPATLPKFTGHDD